MYYFSECALWFSSYMPLKVKGKYCICTGSKNLSSSNFLENGVKLFSYQSAFRKRIVCTLSNANVSRYKVKLELTMISMVTLTFWSITQDRDIRDSVNLSFSDSCRSDKQFDTIFKKIGATLFFAPCINLEITFDLQSPVTLEP